MDKRKRRNRPSIHTLRRDAAKERWSWRESDLRYNEATRLPATEAVHLGGLVLAEVFTPSTVSALYKALEEFQQRRSSNRQDLTARLTRGRSAAGVAGWHTLGVIRPPGSPIFSEGYSDPSLPDGVNAVWLTVAYPMPSLTFVVATFALTDDAGDLSALLRGDYQSEMFDARLRVEGRFGQLRARIPWARPRQFGWWYTFSSAADQKRLACRNYIETYEIACWNWFTARFPGRFSLEKSTERPTARLLLTAECVPFKNRSKRLEAVGLDLAFDVWRSYDPAGWAFKTRDWPEGKRFTATFAARREDAADSPGGGQKGDSAWDLAQRFHHVQSPLVVRWAMGCLMAIYADRLSHLRDRAGRRHRLSRPVGQARDLDSYLIGDGFDASTVTPDIGAFAKNLDRFRRDVPEYVERVDWRSEDDQPIERPDELVPPFPGPEQTEGAEWLPEDDQPIEQPAELVPLLRQQLQAQAESLRRHAVATTTSISASAVLRQAIANTRLQRTILVLTVLATAIAVISLVVAFRALK